MALENGDARRREERLVLAWAFIVFPCLVVDVCLFVVLFSGGRVETDRESKKAFIFEE